MQALPRLDIFKKDTRGNPVWLEAVKDLETARARLHEWVSVLPGEYFAFDQGAHRVVARLFPGAADDHAQHTR